MAFLDILPIRAGHTLVITREHVADLAKLGHGEGEVMRDLVKVVRGLGIGEPMHTTHNSAENLLILCVSASLPLALGDDRLQVITNQVSHG